MGQIVRFNCVSPAFLPTRWTDCLYQGVISIILSASSLIWALFCELIFCGPYSDNLSYRAAELLLVLCGFSLFPVARGRKETLDLNTVLMFHCLLIRCFHEVVSVLGDKKKVVDEFWSCLAELGISFLEWDREGKNSGKKAATEGGKKLDVFYNHKW